MYHIMPTQTKIQMIHFIVNNPSDLPEPSTVDRVEEPYIKATIITKSDFVGQVMSLCIEKRGDITNQTYLTTERVELTFEMPLGRNCLRFLRSS